MRLKDHSVWYLRDDGAVVYDGTRGMRFGEGTDTWRILGFSTRHHARRVITLPEAADGAELGQGWVHDLDHGTHRLWGMPVTKRVVKVWRVAEGERIPAGRHGG